MIERCPVRKCGKFIGCASCRETRRMFNKKNFVTVSTSHRSSLDTLNSIQRAKQLQQNICLSTEKPIERELVWELAYSPQNILQVNVCMMEPVEKLGWAIELIHLAEICGIVCSLVILPIIPNVTKTENVLRVIDSIKNCNHCTIYLKFSPFVQYKPLVYNKTISVNGISIPKEYVTRYNSYMWKCSNLYMEEFYSIVKFYTDTTKFKVVIIQ